MSQLTGTFSGAATVLSFSGSGSGATPGSSLGVNATLTQGADFTPGDATTYNAQVLQGQLQISGIPCFTHGTTAGALSSFLLGNVFNGNFTMDDGSLVFVEGTIDDAPTTHLLLNSVSVAGGICSGTYQIVEPGGTLSRS